MKKHQLSLQKLTFSQHVRWATAHRITVNKMKNLSVSLIKVTLPDRNDRDWLRDVRQLHSLVKLELPGADGLGGPWWRCFFFWLVRLCVCACMLCTSRVSKRKYWATSHIATTTAVLTRWRGKGPPLAINQSIGMAKYADISLPTNQPTGQPAKWGGGTKSYLQWELEWSKIYRKNTKNVWEGGWKKKCLRV